MNFKISTPKVGKSLRHSENRGRISSVGQALDCRAGGREFDSPGQTNTQDKLTYNKLKNKGISFALQAARPSSASNDYLK